MRWTTGWILSGFVCAFACQAADQRLRTYFIDVEGGQATLIVAPSGESLLVDTGWPGARDAGRIASTAKLAGVSRIDHLLITHFHLDHVGGVPDLVRDLPVSEFIDHGETVERDPDGTKLFNAYVTARGSANHRVAKPGDRIPFDGATVEVLTAGGEEIHKPLPGGGQRNAFCGSEAKRDPDPSENARSVGILVSFGRFRMIDLGDLTWNKEFELVCPSNLVGPVDAYVVSHHGMNLSGSRTLVHALRPRVAIMDNGARKGGTPEAVSAIKDSPGLEDLWQLHYSVAGGDSNNADRARIANGAESPDAGAGIEMVAFPDGSFDVTNLATGLSKHYQAR